MNYLRAGCEKGLLDIENGRKASPLYYSYSEKKKKFKRKAATPHFPENVITAVHEQPNDSEYSIKSTSIDQIIPAQQTTHTTYSTLFNTSSSVNKPSLPVPVIQRAPVKPSVTV